MNSGDLITGCGEGAVRAVAPDPLLRIEHLSKTFQSTRALDDVTCEAKPGEVHALVETNGSGKSTLIKVLAGYHRADPGAVAMLNGRHLDLRSDGRHRDLRFVHQDLGRVLQLGAIDNLALARGYLRTRSRRIDWATQSASVAEVFRRFDLDIDLRVPLAEYAPVERVVVAIATALHGWEPGSGVLVLDEPTAVLPPNEVERLFAILREIHVSGAGILYVSHRLDEVFELATRVSVLRDGRMVFTGPTAGLDVPQLTSLMLGEQAVPSGSTNFSPVIGYQQQFEKLWSKSK